MCFQLVNLIETIYEKEKEQLKKKTMKNKKTRLNQMILAAFLVTFLIIGNGTANGKEWKVASGHENVNENKLDLENWMLNENCWNFAGDTYMVETEKDELLNLEAWMVNENKWNLPVFEYSKLEKEQNLMLENWMLNEIFWN